MPTLTAEPPLHHQKSQTNSNPEDQQQEVPTYNLKINPLLDLQRQIHIHHPCFPTAHPSPSALYLNRQHLYIRLHTIYLDMKDATLATFYERIRCSRCGQLPIILDPPVPPTLPLSFQETRTSLLDMNHSLPSEALKLWRTIKKEMEGVDLLRLRRGHLDQVVKGLMEVERLFWESDVGGCGVEAWNGGMNEPPID
jgi:hypothetical protein